MTVSIRTPWAAAVCTAMIALSAAAQEPAPSPEPKPETPAPAAAAEAPPAPPKAKTPLGDPPLHRWGGLTVAVDVWGPSLSNQDYEIAIINAGSDTRIDELAMKDQTREHWKVWYHLPKDMGALRFEYDSMRHEGNVHVFDPGNFVYGELLAFPVFAGLNDDGLADGYSAAATTKTREVRVEYERVVFDTPKTKGSFHIGYRTMDNSREVNANYFALLPAFPPLIPPIYSEDFNPTGLFPVPDTTRMTSDYTGHGLGAGFDVEFKLHQRLSIVGGLSIGALRGGLDTRYAAATSAYYFNDPAGPVLLTFAEVQTLLATDGQGNSPGDLIFQQALTSQIEVRNRARGAYTLDVQMGVQFKIWRSLTGTLGLRELVYADVAADVRTAPPVEQQSGTANFQTVTEIDRTVGYGGYFLGLSYRF
jgi:hypothetical protein